MVRAYYGSKISDNITKLENGCIVCLNVPIARTGIYQYLGNELGMADSDVHDVYRDPVEVFSKETIASFNGAAFTDTHPPCDVTADNWPIYAKGEITNVRQGIGNDEIYLIADILVRDPITINEILSGAKRELSAGYDCEYTENNGKICQTKIRGNHVALVQAGRAGSNVRIYDEKKIKITEKYKINKIIDNALKNVK